VARAGIAVDESIECSGIGAGAAADLLLDITASTSSYRAVNIGADRFQFARTYRPTWAVAVGISLTPVLGLGLLLLLVKRTETWTAVVEQDHRSARIRLTGRILPNVLLSVRASLGSHSVVGVDASWTPMPVAPMPVAPMPVAANVLQPPIRPTSPAFVAPPAPEVVVPTPEPARDRSGDDRLDANRVDPTEREPATERPRRVVVKKRVAVRTPGVAQPQPGGDDGDDDGETRVSRVVGRRRAERGGAHRLVFDTGGQVDGRGLVLIGRDPAPRAGEHDAVLVPIADPDLSVSKTHVSLRFTDDAVWAMDRGSTNGSVVEVPDGTRIELESGVETLVPTGSTVYFGERSCRFEAMEEAGC
jgi:hypothetical protein